MKYWKLTIPGHWAKFVSNHTASIMDECSWLELHGLLDTAFMALDVQCEHAHPSGALIKQQSIKIGLNKTIK